MAITPLPTPPSRDDPANFAARGDAFLGALPDFATELNDALPTINDAIPASEIAVALVNYKGDYNSATTYLVGQSVTYNGVRFLSKKTNLNITPVDGNDWYELTAGAETVVRSILDQSSAITLLASDGGGYLLLSGTTAINVNLPNATTLVGRTFVIKNIGSFPMFVYDAGGNYLFTLSEKTASAIWASDISTTAGQWACQQFPSNYISATVSAGSSGIAYGANQCSVSKLNSTTQIIAYQQSQTSAGAKPYAMVVSQSGGTITTNTGYLISDESASGTAVCMVSSTTGVYVWGSSSGIKACVITVSGTTITAGTPIELYSSGPIYGYIRVVMLSTTAVFFSACITSSSIQGGVLTISGTTLSGTTSTALNNTGTQTQGGYYFLGSLSSSIVALCSEASGGNIYTRIFSISGSTVTSGTAVETSIGGVNAIAGCTLSNSVFAICYYTNSDSYQYIRAQSVSGTTPTMGTAVQVFGSYNYGQLGMGAMSTNSGIIAYYQSATTQYYKGWTRSGTTITLGSASAGPAVGNYYQGADLVAFSDPEPVPSTTATYMSSRLYGNGSNMHTMSMSGTTITQFSNKYLVSAYSSLDVATNTKQLCALSTTRGIFITGAYGDTATATSLVAVLVDYSTSTPTILQALPIGNYGTYASIAALTSTTAIVTYKSNSNTLVTNLITMSGNTISVGSQATISSATTISYQSVCRLSDTTAVAFYRNSSTSAYINLLTVSGTSVSASSPATVSSSDVSECQVEALSSSTLLVTYYQSGTKGRVIGISGSTFTINAQTAIDIGNYKGAHLTVMSSTKAILSAGGDTTGDSGHINILTISGTAISSGLQASVKDMYYGFRIAMSSSTKGIAINPYYRYYFDLTIDNGIPSVSNQKPMAAYSVAPLKTPALASNYASKIAVYGNDSYSLQNNQVYSIGAIL